MTLNELFRDLQSRLEDYPELGNQTINGIEDDIVINHNGKDYYLSLEDAE
jgi:hypothetical protein